MLNIYLNKTEEENILNGFPWVYNNEINHFDGVIKSGEIVKVYSFNKEFVCYGFFNMASKITIRVLSLVEDEVIDESFFRERMLYAIEHRNTLQFGDTCRLIFAEADFLPGLIVDKYGDYLSVQFLCLGMEVIKNMIVKLLIELTNCKGIYERSDVSVRTLEGLEETKGYLFNEFDPLVIVEENGIKMRVDIKDGQKTGYFLDQKLNRDFLKYLVKDKVMLDCFSHTGGFALHACKYGAKEVVACDISSKACDDILFNASLNNYKINAVCDDVFNFLRKEENKNRFSLIVLDPPGFIKKKEALKKGISGYKEINLQALKIIKKGGYLLTFSCSQHMTPELFMEMFREAVKDSKRTVQFLDFRIQSLDHPALLSSNEQLYLKCLVVRVL